MSQDDVDAAGGRSPGRGWEGGTLVAVIQGVLTGVGGVYVTTRSIAVTSIACAAAIGLAALLVVRRQERQDATPTPRGRPRGQSSQSQRPRSATPSKSHQRRT